jgi:hypothetical protein
LEASMPTSTADNTNVKINIEKRLSMSFGILLAFISMILTVSLFMSLAGDDLIRQIVMITLAVGLEGAKLLTFRMGKGFRIISVCLIIISVVASFGSALLVIESNQHIAARNASTEQARSFNKQEEVKNLGFIDDQINALIEQFKALPPDYISAGKDLNAAISVLREKRGEVMRSIKVNVDDAPVLMTVTMFGLISKIIGFSEDGFILAILMFMAVILEASILALTRQYPTVLPMEKDLSYPEAEMSHSPTETSYTQEAKNECRTSIRAPGGIIPQTDFETPPTLSYEAIEKDLKTDEFLNAMIDENTYPILRGRDATAQRLGIPAYTAKVLVNRLIQDGKIKVEGKRLVMCRTVLRPDSEDSSDIEVGLKLDS